MFKISNPELNNLVSFKYKEIKNNYKLENIYIENENIKLDTNVEIKSCKFNGVVFDEVNIKFGKLEDVEFINCNLSSLGFMDTTFFRVKFENCKLFGTNFVDSDFDNVIIKDSMCNLINIAGLKIQNSELTNSNFKESRIMSCTLKNIIIEDVNLSKSDIIDTSLKDIDLSSSNTDSIKVDLKSIKGVIINFEQAIDLIGLLDVKIKE